MKKITLILSFVAFAAVKVIAQSPCNNTLTVTVSGVVNSSTCITPCNGQATGNSSTATGWLWTPGNQQTQTATGLCAGTYTVYGYDASFNCGSATVTITCPSAVNEIDGSASVDLFPNPASTDISITLSHPNGGNVSEVSVFNLIGEKVLSEQFASSKKFSNSIYVGNLPAGTYFIEMKDEKNTYRAKFVKQ